MAKKWLSDNPPPYNPMQHQAVLYNIESAERCREEGGINAWTGPVSALKLEWELQSITERFCGKDVHGGTISYFQQFSPAQRRVLMFLFEELTKAWVRHRRQSIAIERATKKVFVGDTLSEDV
jgi:hypothetical protein